MNTWDLPRETHIEIAPDLEFRRMAFKFLALVLSEDFDSLKTLIGKLGTPVLARTLGHTAVKYLKI